MKKIENNKTNNKEMITISRAEYENLKAQIRRVSELESRVDLLTEALRLSRHKKFGASSETISEEAAEQLSFLFNEAEAYDDAAKEEEKATTVAAHKRHKKHEYTLDNIPENVPVEEVHHTLEGDELTCPNCGETMTEIGKEVVNTLELIPAKVVVKKHIYYTYACKKCNNEGIETPVRKAAREKNIIPGSFSTPEAIAHIMTQKFVMGSPLYRQEQELNRQGIMLSRQTMSNWILKASQMYLEPVYEEFHRELLKREVLHADETTLQVLHEPGKEPQSKSYMWLYRTSGDTDKPVVMYEYQPGRGAVHPKEFLEGFKGCLHTDGYAGYHNLPQDITVVGCWAHLRRKFDEAMKSLPKGKAKNSSAAQGLAYCTLLFEIEKGFSQVSPRERYTRRLKQEKPVLDAFFAWANVRNAAPKSALGKALTYLKEQWPYLTNYLKDGRLELSNNRAERSIKPFVIDRKNFMFANTPGGAKGSAVIFTMIQTATENHLDPYKYLVWLLKTASATDMTNPDMIKSLLPWNAPTYCKIK